MSAYTLETTIWRPFVRPICFALMNLVGMLGISAWATAAPTTAVPGDWRNIETGWDIPSEGYCDQPYVVLLPDGTWLCTLTTGSGHEGALGQHVVSTTSRDHGKTWTPLVDIEPASNLDASWAMPLLTPSGRVYAFYTYNGDNVRALGNKKNIRADILGWYCYRYTDDGGKSWSDKRYRLPMRISAVDRKNNWQGEVQIFWGIGKPITWKDSAIFGFTRIGKYMLEESEGWFYRSDNILKEMDVDKLAWQLLPDGDHGLRAPEFGTIQSEQNLVPLDDGSLYCMYRTITGYPCHAYSRDGGHTWTKPEHATYTPGGQRMKTPRACPRLWKTKNGKYLFWFHNHSGKEYFGRNPAWVSGGIEKDGFIHWSQPEILLYSPIDEKIRQDDMKAIRMSYPDLIEQDGRYWVTETQKSIARVHEVDGTLFEGLWNQGIAKEVPQDGLVLSANGKPGILQTPALDDLGNHGGFTLELWIKPGKDNARPILLDTRDNRGKGITVTSTGNGSVRLELSDGKTTVSWECDEGLLKPGELHHVTAIVEAGPKIILYVIDGKVCDGSEQRRYGWGRFPQALGNINGADTLKLSNDIKHLRIYNRPLRTSEAIAAFQAGI